MRQLLRRLRYLVDRKRYDSELANDLEFHSEMSARAGRLLARTLQVREEARDAWGWTWIDRFAQDLRYAARMLRRSPGFTLVAILMLAAGIGVNVAVFGFFDLMVLRPLNVRDPATLLRFHRRAQDSFAFAMPYPEVTFFQEHSRTLSAVLALNTTKLAIEGEDRQAGVNFVTPNFFSELGATPAVGSLWYPTQDQTANENPGVVLGYGFWQRRFGGDPSVVGKTIRVNDKPVTVIGVAAREFSGLSLDDPALWAPLTLQPYFAGGSLLLTDTAADTGGVRMWGRLQPGLAPKAAEDELKLLAKEFHKQHPNDTWKKENLISEPGGFATGLMIGDRQGSGSEGSNELAPIIALVGCLGLLILAVACANLGSLLLARGVAREREMAIRVSVGAGKGRLIRQLLTESLVLALGGCLAGMAVGYAVLRGLMAVTDTPAWLDPSPDWRVALFAVGVGIVAVALFGLTPALQLVRQRHRAAIARQILVGAQVAASCVLLIVAGLLSRALEHATSSDPGFDYKSVISIDPGLGRHGYTAAASRTYLDTLQSRLRTLPGVASVSLALVPPLGNVSIGAGIDIDGRHVTMQINHVDPQFFETMRIPLLRGRNLARGETHAVIVSESLARQAWPGRDPLGRKFPLDGDSTVVGIAGNARTVKLEDSDSAEAYLPIDPDDLPRMWVLVKAIGTAEGIARSVASTAKTVDPRMFPELQLLKAGFSRKLRGAETSALAVTVLGSIAHLLACLGIFGVVAYAVSQRTKEIGIRMALGAQPSSILAVTLAQFGLPVIGGLLVGVAGAAALSSLLSGLLFGISHLDPVAYATAIVIFLVTVALAALLPARRALRVDPMRALRWE